MYQSFGTMDKSRKRNSLEAARKNFDYTLKNMKPGCPLRREVSANLQGVEFQIKLLGQ